MRRIATLIALALALPALSAQPRFRPSPAMLDGGFAVQQSPTDQIYMPIAQAVVPNYQAAPAATQGHGFRRKASKLGRIVRASIPYMYAAYLGEQDWYWLQHALEPFPVPKKPR